MTQSDQLHRFIFRDEHVRGETVQLSNSINTLLETTQYPTPIRNLLAKMASAAALLSATLKFEGEISLQVQGKGPVSYAVLSATHELTFRGVARWDESLDNLPDSFDALCAESVLVITLSPNEGERYQGVVALDKPTLAECIENYFAQSEQLLTRVYLFSDAMTEGQARAGGLLLQVMPESSEATSAKDADSFHHFATLADTLTEEESLSLPVQTLLHRLYHEHDIELFDGKPVSYACTCSRERSAAALQHVEKQELLSIIDAEGAVTMNCQYCNKVYSFDAIDVEAGHAGTNVGAVSDNTGGATH